MLQQLLQHVLLQICCFFSEAAMFLQHVLLQNIVSATIVAAILLLQHEMLHNNAAGIDGASMK
jgi:quinol-cytochrome oxidoreductase complex cytochrome b subunit